MTPQRVLILVAVLLVALTAIGFALGRSQRKDVDPGSSRFHSFLPKRRTNDLGAFTVSGGRWEPSSGMWTLDAKVPVASLQIGELNGGWNKIRSVKLGYSGADPVEIRYTPKRDPGSVGKFIDEGASELRIPKLQPGKTLELTLLEHGGQLEVRRLGLKGPAVFKVE